MELQIIDCHVIISILLPSITRLRLDTVLINIVSTAIFALNINFLRHCFMITIHTIDLYIRYINVSWDWHHQSLLLYSLPVFVTSLQLLTLSNVTLRMVYTFMSWNDMKYKHCLSDSLRRITLGLCDAFLKCLCLNNTSNGIESNFNM